MRAPKRHLRRTLKIAVLACLVADLALLGWLLSPRAPSRSAMTAQVAAARSHYVAMRLRAVQLARLQQRIHTSELQMRTLLAQGFPEQKHASSQLLTEISRIADRSHVMVSGAQFHPDKKAQHGLRRISISLQVAGPYAGVVGFVNRIERSPMFFIIHQISASGAARVVNQAGSGDQVKLQVQMEGYERAERT
jgi:Tfp pilus assembly protein PilO